MTVVVRKNIGTAFCYGRTNLILMALRQRWIGVLLLIVLQMFWTFFYGDRSRYFINVLYVYKRSFSEVYRWQLWYYRLFCVFNKWKVHPIWNCCPYLCLKFAVPAQSSVLRVTIVVCFYCPWSVIFVMCFFHTSWCISNIITRDLRSCVVLIYKLDGDFIFCCIRL